MAVEIEGVTSEDSVKKFSIGNNTVRNISDGSVVKLSEIGNEVTSEENYVIEEEYYSGNANNNIKPKQELYENLNFNCENISNFDEFKKILKKIQIGF